MLSCVKCELRAAAAVQERTGQDRLGRNMLVHTQLCIVCTKFCMLGTVGLLCAQSCVIYNFSQQSYS